MITNKFRQVRAITRTMRKADWRLIIGGQLRTIDGQCPITQVCQAETAQLHHPDYWRIAAERLGLPPSLALEIVCAADAAYRTDFHAVRKLRRILLRAAGMQL